MPADAAITGSSQDATELLTVTAAAPESPQTFLHLIYLSPGANAHVPSQVDAIDTADEQGVGFDDRDGLRWEIVFDPDGVGLVAVRNGQMDDVPPAAPGNLQVQ
jgi:hypothetical protein